MAEPNSESTEQPADPNEPQVVYRRTDSPDDESSGARPQTPGPSFRQGIAPAVTPLLIGFTLLLIVIYVLGFLSIRKVEGVGFEVLDLERQYAAHLSLLLEMRLALTRLDNEARARKDADETGGLRPPFDVRLRTARQEINKLRPALERPPLTESSKWDQFRRDLEAYVKVTEDARQYSLEGFPRFRTVDIELNDLLADSTGSEAEILQAGRSLQQSAVRSIRIWSLIALVVGFIVAAGTGWEIQARFR